MRSSHLLSILALSLVPLAACVRPHGERLTPQRTSAVARARAELVQAAGTRDLDAVLRHFAPDARLIVGSDTQDLRAAAERFAATVPEGATTRLWFAPYRLSTCDRWLYESGGELGFNVAAPGVPESQRRWLYAIAWTTDSTGLALIQTLALVEREYGPPVIWGCRPSAKESFEVRRAGVAILPSLGMMYHSAVTGLEDAMRGRHVVPTPHVGVAGYRRSLVTIPPPLGAVWWRLTPRITLEAVWPLANISAATTGVDTAAFLATGLRMEQRWAALLAGIRLADLSLAAGPAFVREAWWVTIDEATMDTTTGVATIGPNMTAAGSTRNRVGLLVEGRMLAPVTGRFFAELRVFGLFLPSSTTPPCYGSPSMRVSTSSFGIGLFAGVGF